MKRFFYLLAISCLFLLNSCQCEHTFSEYKIQLPATCSTPGVETRTCTKCDIPESRELPVLPHTFGNWETTKDATCIAVGEQTQTCSVCGDMKTRATDLIPHSYGEWKTTKDATCITVGEQTQTCSVCGDMKTRATDLIPHSYGEWKTTKDATCIAVGEQTQTCSVCGDMKTRATDLVSHSYGEWKTTTAASCTSNGLKKHYCTMCGVEESATLYATGHKYSSTTVSTVTCTQNGLLKYICSNCQDTYEKSLPALGHKWQNATCTSPQKCATCGITSGNSLGHETGNNGNCTRCGTKISIDMKTVISEPTERFASLRGKNSVGLVELNWTANNNSGKTINYYTVTVYYYNAVGDPAKNDITRKTSYTVKYVGPVKPGNMIMVGDVGYCSICREVVIGEITLEYSDGTTDTGWYGYRFSIP